MPTLMLEYHSWSSRASGHHRRLSGEAQWRPDEAVHHAAHPAMRVVHRQGSQSQSCCGMDSWVWPWLSRHLLSRYSPTGSTRVDVGGGGIHHYQAYVLRLKIYCGLQ